MLKKRVVVAVIIASLGLLGIVLASIEKKPGKIEPTDQKTLIFEPTISLTSPTAQPLPTTAPQSPTQSPVTINTSGTLYSDSHSIPFAVSFPKDGGAVNIESGMGICFGKGAGNFNQTTTVVSGTISGTCNYYGIEISSSGTFSGNIYLKDGHLVV